MTTKTLYFKDALNKKLKDPEFRKLYEEEQEAFEVACTVLELRYDSGLSQEEFARCAGTTRQVVSRVESGDYETLSLQTLKKLLDAGGVKLVLGLEDAPKETKVLAHARSVPVRAAERKRIGARRTRSRVASRFIRRGSRK